MKIDPKDCPNAQLCNMTSIALEREGKKAFICTMIDCKESCLRIMEYTLEESITK